MGPADNARSVMFQWVLTKMGDGMPIQTLRHLTPAELNTHKPDPLMFEAAVKATGFKAGEICHVGDHPINDVKASHEFGNKSIWFKENGKELDLDIEVPCFSNWRDLPGLLENI